MLFNASFSRAVGHISHKLRTKLNKAMVKKKNKNEFHVNSKHELELSFVGIEMTFRKFVALFVANGKRINSMLNNHMIEVFHFKFILLFDQFEDFHCDLALKEIYSKRFSCNALEMDFIVLKDETSSHPPNKKECSFKHLIGFQR